MTSLKSTVARLADEVLSRDLPVGCQDVETLLVYKTTAPSEVDAMIYDPIVCLILQGEKATKVGDRDVILSSGQCLVVGHDMPVLARISKTSIKRPYVSVVIRLDMDELRSLDATLSELDLPASEARSFEVAPVDEATLQVIERYIALLDNPVEAEVLLPLIRKELHFRLFMSESGAMLRALLNRDSHASNVARAIQTLRQTYRDTLDVPALARSVGMSASAFHKHFKAMTATTPLQFQKDLRLTEARRLLQTGQSTVSKAAFEVGYESPSQFSREYSRKFGASPRADLNVA